MMLDNELEESFWASLEKQLNTFEVGLVEKAYF